MTCRCLSMESVYPVIASCNEFNPSALTTSKQGKLVAAAVVLSPLNAEVKSWSGAGMLEGLLSCFSRHRRVRRRERKQQKQLQLQQEQQLPLLLAPQDPALANRICAVIDLDETLVHSTFNKPVKRDADFSVEVEISGELRTIYVQKRPFVDEFLQKMGQLFECVLFTASLAKYAMPVSDELDHFHAFRHRLFREACVLRSHSFVKDLSKLGRQLDRCFIIDNSPSCYKLQRSNAVPISTWLGNQKDTELRDLLPYLEKLASVESVTEYILNEPPPSDSDSDTDSLYDSGCFCYF